MTSSTTLEFLLVSENYQTLTAVSQAIKQIGASLGFAPAADSAHEYLQRRKVDGIFVDMEVSGAENLIASIRQGMSNRHAVVFACVPSPTASPVVFVTGATFLLQKPLTMESVAANLNAAQEMMAREKRQYFRLPVNLPVFLMADGVEQRAMMTNLSEGGMALRLVKPLAHRSIVEFTFELSSGATIRGKGLTAWANNDGMIGLKFQFLRGDGASRLQEWLNARLDITSRMGARSMAGPAGESD
jgi:response regulator RpfG family c-di-GMP phosphodiesterase